MSVEKITRNLEGVVVSNKMNQTIVVSVERQVSHAKYGKIIKKSSKFHAHDADNVANEGDVVIIKECKPISKTKSWMLVNVKQCANVAQ